MEHVIPGSAQTAYSSVRRFDEVEVVHLSYVDCRVVAISPSPGTVTWVHVLGDDATIEAAHRLLAMGSGSLAFLADSEPFRVHLSEGATVGILRIGAEEFAAQGVALPRAGTQVWSAATGANLVGRFLEGLALDASYHPANPGRLGRTLVSILAFLWVETRAGQSAAPQEIALTQAKHYIENNLGDMDLDPAAIARALNLSTRSLHRLFAGEGRTVGGWIRERRMEQCRLDLRDPSLAGDPVASIGSRWGIPDAAHFSRLFKATYGSSPREFRQREHTLVAAA